MTSHTVESIEDIELDTPVFYRLELTCSVDEESARNFLFKVARFERAGGRIEEAHRDANRARGENVTLLWGEIFWEIESAFKAGFSAEQIAEMVEYTYPDLLGRSIDGAVGRDPWERLIASVQNLQETEGPFEQIDSSGKDLDPELLVSPIAHDHVLACLALHVPELREDRQIRAACQKFLPDPGIARGLVRDLRGHDLANAFRNVVQVGPGGCQAAAALLEEFPQRFTGVLDRRDLTPLLRSDFRRTRKQALRFLHQLEQSSTSRPRSR